MELYFGFDHDHGQSSTNGLDEFGHFGEFDPACRGKVVHYVEDSEVIYDGIPPRRLLEALAAGQEESDNGLVEPEIPSEPLDQSE